jgi:Helix-turn-helix of insertion element transposase
MRWITIGGENTVAETDGALVPKLTKEMYDLLLYLEQSYWRSSSLPSYEAIAASGIELSESVYYEAWINPRFVDALRSRGIPEHLLRTESGTFNGRILTEKQMQVANVLLDTLDKRSRLKKLTELGISTAEYNQWLRDPIYRQYCLERSEQLLLDNQHVAHMSLIDRVAQGDISAIKYFNSMTGRYRERAQTAVEVNVQNNYGNDTLISIVEIIQRHVKDPAVLSAIGDDILALQRGNQPDVVTMPSGASGYVEPAPKSIEGSII